MKSARNTYSLAIAFVVILATQIHGQTVDLPDLVEKVKPAVASITVYDDKYKPLGIATGFFISPDLFVTSQHVVSSEDIKNVRATFPDGSYLDAERVISWHPQTDLAILRLAFNKKVGSHLRLSKTEPRVGEKVVVIGNPSGLGWTVSEGIISASRESREKGYRVRRLQISADISPGSSGSPVLNLRGEVVGVIESSLVDERRLNQRLNFATPSSYIKIEPSGASIAPPVIDFSDVAGENNRSTPRKYQFNVLVHSDDAGNGWTDTRIAVRRGDRLRVSATGSISLGQNRSSSPAGLPRIVDTEKLMRNEPTGALIAVIGDDNDEFIFVGSGRDFYAPRDGRLFLGVNEGNLADNTGAYSVTVEIIY